MSQSMKFSKFKISTMLIVALLIGFVAGYSFGFIRGFETAIKAGIEVLKYTDIQQIVEFIRNNLI